MRTPFESLDKVLEHSLRLHIISVLAVNEGYDYNSLKDLLKITDGNLATHMKTLEREKYVTISKSFIDRKPNTRYRVTEKGRTAFRKHLEAMAELIRQQRK